MKRKIVETLVNHKKEGGTSTKIPNRAMLGFQDCEGIGGTPNEIFPLVIISMVIHFDVSQTLIEGESSCDIMYYELFESMGLNRGNLWSYDGSELQDLTT